MRALPCAPAICLRSGITWNSPNSASRTGGRRRRCSGPRRACGCSRTIARTSSCCCLRSSSCPRPAARPTRSSTCGELSKRGRALKFTNCSSRGGGQAAGERAVTFLETCLADKGRPHWAYAGLLMRILIHEKNFSAAWAAVRKHGASIHVKLELARAAEAEHPREVLEVYAAQVEQLANAGGDYAEATKLVARMAQLQTAAAQASFVAGLKVRHARKRNFMKLLG